jgi:hypothetical protein
MGVDPRTPPQPAQLVAVAPTLHDLAPLQTHYVVVLDLGYAHFRELFFYERRLIG